MKVEVRPPAWRRRARAFSFFVFTSFSHTVLCPAAASNGQVPKPPKPPPKPRTVQSSLKPKLAMAEVATDSSYVTASPVLPELTADNAATRYVFVPAHEFGSEGIGGWVARCVLPPPRTPQHPRERAGRTIVPPARPYCPACFFWGFRVDCSPLRRWLLPVCF